MKNIGLFFICLMLISCAVIPDQPYHKISCSSEFYCSNSELDSYIKPTENMKVMNGWSAVSNKEMVNIKGDVVYNTSFNLFYLEYDEKGHKFEKNRQLDIIKRAISNSDKPIYLVVYVHGWHNNASIDIKNRSLDTTGFPYMLARRNFQNPNMNVIGVYIGWRGEKYKYSPAKIFSVQDRAHIADVIGNEGELHKDIVTLVENVQNSTHSGYSLIIGHSFGGRILSRAFMNDLMETKSIANWPLGSQSLIVTLNPAIGADAFDDLYKKRPGLGINVQRPLWLNMTSKDDKATSKIFPAARFIGLNVSDTSHSDKYQTIGHYIPYLSHEITVVSGFDKKPECNFIYPTLVLKSNTPWFQLPPRDGCATRHLYEYKDFQEADGRYYTTVLRPLYENPEKPLWYMWNFRTDSSVIDYSIDEAKINKSYGKHNAFVQTTLGRMLDDMLFTAPVKTSSLVNK